MRSQSRTRAFGLAVALALLLVATPGVAKATSYQLIGGTITDAQTGLPIAGITVSIGEGDSAVVTGADGTYLLQIDTPGTDGGFVVFLDDSQHRYLYGWYDADVPVTHFADAGTSWVYPGDSGAFGVDVEMTLARHISGTITGQGTPPKPLANLAVLAVANDGWSDYGITAADGSYTLSVPGSASVPGGVRIVVVFYPPSVYQMGCWAHGYSQEAGCALALLVQDADLTGIDAQLPLIAGDSLVLGPVGGTVPAGSAISMTATLAGAGPQARPAEPRIPYPLSEPDPNVSDNAVFSISGGGTCTHNACTPPSEGDYTITATYGDATGQTIIHAGPAAPLPSASPSPSDSTSPSASPSPAATPSPSGMPSPSTSPSSSLSAAATLPTTSTRRPDGGQEGSLPAAMLLGLAAAALITATVMRRGLLVRPTPCLADPA